LAFLDADVVFGVNLSGDPARDGVHFHADEAIAWLALAPPKATAL
jgi:hypothetical protein